MGAPSTTAAHDFKAALAAAMRTLTADDDQVLVSFGNPGQQGLNFTDWVMFEDLTSEQSPATMGTNRSREEILTQLVVLECFRAGGPEAEELASDAAYALLGLLEQHVRQTDTTVGATVRQCFLSSHRSQGFTSPVDQVQGRTILVEATFTAAVRII